jgi:gamma-glutamyltranspeptidase/glutathione hydrolase
MKVLFCFLQKWIPGSIRLSAVAFLLVSLFLSGCGSGIERGRRGMVSSQHPLASEVGLSILQSGGNAVDAAVATAFALGIVEPYHSGIGGGSFIMIRNAASGDVVAIDAREKAPMAATRDMYQREGEVVGGLSSYGSLAVGVPGTVAGLVLALEKYGTKTLREVIDPSIEIAVKGIEVDPFFHKVLAGKADFLMRFPETASIYLSSGNRPYPAGYRLIQKDLAHTYRELSLRGVSSFYHGKIAGAIVDHMKETGGIITLEDLNNYAPVIREPVRGTYRDFEVISMPPPSSGGVHLIQMLNMLEEFDLSRADPLDTKYLDLLIRAMSLAFADRAEFMGDVDYVDVPVEKLLSKDYARELHEKMLEDLRKGKIPGEESKGGGGGTTHISVIDSVGNVVSLTQTINLWFGSCVTVPGTGIILNDEMDDFSAMPGVPNEFGLVGSEANAIEPGKRPLSSMSPTIILKDGKPFLVVGSRGGPRIITSTLQVAINVIDFGMSLDQAIEAPRVHHQWLPGIVYVEENTPSEIRRALGLKGYKTKVLQDRIGCVSGILVSEDDGLIYGASDPRGIGEARGY